jgi:hypothetical protein
MQTSTCSTSRLSGVPLTRSITRLSVSMPTIGRTLGENLIYLTTSTISFALTGRQVPSLANMKRDAYYSLPVLGAMAGRSRNFTLSTTRPSLVKIQSAIK